MNTLCFTTNLTSSELAAWVQAIGTIVAVISAAAIAIYQSKQQHKSALALQQKEQKTVRLEQAKTLLVLCQNCSKAVNHFMIEIQSIERCQKILDREIYFDFGEFRALENSTSNLPLQNLPAEVLTPAMVLAANLRQLKQNLNVATDLLTTKGPEQYREFLTVVTNINESLKLTCNDIQIACNLIDQAT